MSENKKKFDKKLDKQTSMSNITDQRLLPEVLNSDLHLAIDLVLIDEQGRKVDLFGRVATCFICRGETSSGRGNVELLHPDGGRGPFSGQATKTGRKMEQAEATTDECDSQRETTHSFSEKLYY